MNRRVIISLIVATIVVGAGLWGLGVLRQRIQDQRKLAFAQRLVRTGRAEEAISIVKARRRWPNDTPQHRAWLRVCVDIFEQTGDAIRLGQIYYDSPEVLHHSESASILAARALILKSDMANFERLRMQWRGREEHAHAWTILECDALLRQGRRAQALALLAESPLQDRWESSRQIRLALLHASQPENAWQHLSNALKNDPNQAMARLFRGQLLEAAGRWDEARLEYVGARLAEPHNAAICDQLAEFYHRRGNFRLMLDTWQAAEGDARADFIDLKTAFWSRVALPVTTSANLATHQPLSHGPLEGLVQMVTSLSPTRFWDESQVSLHENAHAKLHRPEAKWLMRLEHIRSERYDEALSSLRDKPQTAWEAPMRRTLMMVLNLRLFGELDPTGELRRDMPVSSNEHPLIAALNIAHARDEDLKPGLAQLLRGPHGIGAALMAHGWLQASIRFSGDQPLPDTAPTWAAYGLTQAVRLTRGPASALEFASNQPNSRQLDLLKSELLIELDSIELALERLQPLAILDKANDALGARANFLAIVALLETKQYERAQQWIDQHPAYALTQTGKEMRAKIALLRHDVDTAFSVFDEIRETSVEAKAFFAKNAAHEGNWKEARQYTLELLREFPANQSLLSSLEEIERRIAESASQPQASAENLGEQVHTRRTIGRMTSMGAE